MPEFSHVSPGDDFRGNITARWYNHVTHPPRREPTMQAMRPGKQTAAGCVVLVKNTTEIDVPRGGVLGLADAIIKASESAATFAARPDQVDGVAPARADHGGRLAIALEPIPAGAIRKAVAFGVAAARVEITNVGHRFAELVDGAVTHLRSASSGAIPMVPSEGGTGAKWATVYLGGAGKAVTIIKGRAVGAVAAGDPSFLIDNIDLISGVDPRSDPTSLVESVTVANTWGQEYSDNELLQAIKRDNSATFEPFQVGSSIGSQVVHYELTQNMAFADAARLAKPVLPDGTLDTGAAAFYVVDPQQQYYGRAAFTDPLGAKLGYRGFALRYTDDYNSTGVPGYLILSQEGPLLLLVVTLSEDGQTSGTTTAVPAENGAYGKPFRGRLPAADSATGAFEVHDQWQVAKTAKQGEKWLVAFDETSEHYDLLMRVGGPNYRRIRGKVAATVTRSDATLTLNNVEAVDGESPVSGVNDQVTVAIPPNAKMDVPNGTTDWIYAVYDEKAGNSATNRWSSGDESNHYWVMRGHVGFSSSLFRVLTVEGNTESTMKWLSIEDALRELGGWTAGNNQSIGHDAAGNPLWQNDGSC